MNAEPQGTVHTVGTGGTDDSAGTDGDATPAPPQTHHSTPPQPPLTGDLGLDAAMRELAQAQSQPFADRIDSGERVHRLLQGRLGDLGRA